MDYINHLLVLLPVYTYSIPRHLRVYYELKIHLLSTCVAIGLCKAQHCRVSKPHGKLRTHLSVFCGPHLASKTYFRNIERFLTQVIPGSVHFSVHLDQ